ncbi:MAG: MltA domain-containing protein [Nitrospinae bacterium]|nr:MltA domain-containing protein [Nitrospinota bacterium]MDA1110275.1 MltA domain-containing protein [Nitrospinota bacterium]
MSSLIKNNLQQPLQKRTVRALCFLFIVALFFFLDSCSTYSSPVGPNGQLTSSDNSNADRSSASGSEPANQTVSSTQSLPNQPTRPQSLSLDLPIIFEDDLDQESLKKVIQNQLDAMEAINEFEPVRLENLALTKGKLKKALKTFLNLLNQNLAPDEFSRRVRQEFTFYKAGQGARKKFLFTGYYTPVIVASPVKTEEYIYPIYRVPDAPVELNFVGNPPSPIWKNYTRRQIDHQGILKNRNLEIAWLKDDLERFFLHIQGSGALQFPDGKLQGVRFAGANNYDYQGIGKLMVKDGLLTGKGERTMQGIKKYLRDHPSLIPKYLHQNKRYIFFAYSDEGPTGSGGGELVGGRSIATDKSIYPAGGLALLFIRKPILNEAHEIVRWKRSFRFVVDQDTGSDINGPGRGDLFFGIGQRPGIMAGNFKEWGEVYYLVKK